MDRRNNPRVEVQLPVQIWGMDIFGQPFTAAALITNMSTGGLVVQGVRPRIRVGEIVDIRMGEERAQFRVVWVGGLGTRSAGELGLQRVTAEAFIPDSVLVYCSQSAAAC
jgi:hypothetical protein